MKYKSLGTCPLITGNCKTRKGLIGKILRLYGTMSYSQIAERCAVSTYTVFTIIKEAHREQEFYHATTQSYGPNVKVAEFVNALVNISKRYGFCLDMASASIAPCCKERLEELESLLVLGVEPDELAGSAVYGIRAEDK